MFYRTIVLFVLASVCLATSWLYFSRQSPNNTQPSLVVGIAAGYAPFVSINAQGEYEGFDIDVAYAIANRMGKKLVLKDLGSMAPLFMALEQNSIEAIMWGLSITKERLQKVSMIQYQGETTTSYPLMFWGNIPAGIRSINDMKNMVVCVEPTSSQDSVLSKYTDIIKLPTEKVDDALLAIQYGKANAALVEPTIAEKFKRKYPNIVTLDIQLTGDEQVYGVGVAIKKSNNALSQDMQNTINALKADGTLQSLAIKWGVS